MVTGDRAALKQHREGKCLRDDIERNGRMSRRRRSRTRPKTGNEKRWDPMKQGTVNPEFAHAVALTGGKARTRGWFPRPKIQKFNAGRHRGEHLGHQRPWQPGLPTGPPPTASAKSHAQEALSEIREAMTELASSGSRGEAIDAESLATHLQKARDEVSVTLVAEASV